MPDGTVLYLSPFHLSMEGMETVVLCRDDEDYDAMVKIICVSAKRKNVIVVIYAVVSNHCHVALLAASQEDAEAYGVELKRMYSMWFSRKYGQKGLMRGVDIKALPLETNWHVRNSLAYIPRNALDNGCNVQEYQWSGFRGMFGGDKEEGAIPVKSLSKWDRREIMHTGDDLRDVPWLLDRNWSLVPSSFCDCSYLEQAFEGDQAFYMKVLGGLNTAEMKHNLVDVCRLMRTDVEFFKSVQDISLRWYQTNLSDLSEEKKIRLVVYVSRMMKTTVPQMSRVFGISRERVSEILGVQPLLAGKV